MEKLEPEPEPEPVISLEKIQSVNYNSITLENLLVWGTYLATSYEPCVYSELFEAYMRIIIHAYNALFTAYNLEDSTLNMELIKQIASMFKTAAYQANAIKIVITYPPTSSQPRTTKSRTTQPNEIQARIDWARKCFENVSATLYKAVEHGYIYGDLDCNFDEQIALANSVFVSMANDAMGCVNACLQFYGVY